VADERTYDPLGDLVDRSAVPVPPVTDIRWWRRRPRVSRVVVGVVGVLVLYYVVSLVQVVQAGRGSYDEPVDAIVVLGAAQYDGRPSPQLAARLDHALTLWEERVAPVVMVTGGKLPGDRFTEAEASRRYLLDHGVPESVILMENEGRTTYDSLESAAAILLGAGLDEVVLVSDPFHMKRSDLIADGLGLDAHVSATPTSVVTGWVSARRHAREAAGVALGRLVGFDRLSELTG
jgi:uncharacterized SAM-binding protein YcdF (DUF218 family)